MKYYVIADVHSFYDEMIEALDEKGFFNDKEPHKLIVCGDLFDRGDKSVELQDFIVELLHKDEVVLIKGNHEDLMLDLLENADHYFNKGIMFSHHWSNGTVKTMFDLTGMCVGTFSPQEVVDRMRNTSFIKEIIPSMVDYFETEQYIFVHGWIPAIVLRDYGYRYLPIAEWRNCNAEQWEKARWINGMDAWSQGVKEEGKTIVCGHFHTSWGHCYLEKQCEEFGGNANFTPFYGDGIIALDACTALTGKVNCVIVED